MWGVLKAFVKTVIRPITYAAESLLLFAVNNNFNRVANLLIKCRVNVNCNNSEGTPLWHAVNNGNLYLVNELLANGADVNSQANKDSRTVLHLAAQKNAIGSRLREDYISKVNNDIIDALIAVKPKMNLGDKDGRTPLHIAVNRCYLFATKAFIKSGANLDIRDNNQETPIMHIVPHTSYANNNARAILRVLSLSGARLDLVDKSNRTVLQKVADCISGFDQHLACKTLLFYGAKLEDLTKGTNNPKDLVFINRMMRFETPFLGNSSLKEHDQKSCIKKSASIRASISEKMHALHTKKVSAETMFMLRLHKLTNLPERTYPGHNRLQVQVRDFMSTNGCKLKY